MKISEFKQKYKTCPFCKGDNILEAIASTPTWLFNANTLTTISNSECPHADDEFIFCINHLEHGMVFNIIIDKNNYIKMRNVKRINGVINDFSIPDSIANTDFLKFIATSLSCDNRFPIEYSLLSHAIEEGIFLRSSCRNDKCLSKFNITSSILTLKEPAHNKKFKNNNSYKYQLDTIIEDQEYFIVDKYIVGNHMSENMHILSIDDTYTFVTNANVVPLEIKLNGCLNPYLLSFEKLLYNVKVAFMMI